MQWLATAFSLLGALLNIKKVRWGFALWIGSCVLWIWWALLSSPVPVGFIITQAVFFVINVFGFIEWSRPKPSLEERIRLSQVGRG